LTADGAMFSGNRAVLLASVIERSLISAMQKPPKFGQEKSPARG
jgi:hypothetical protein